MGPPRPMTSRIAGSSALPKVSKQMSMPDGSDANCSPDLVMSPQDS